MLSNSFNVVPTCRPKNRHIHFKKTSIQGNGREFIDWLIDTLTRVTLSDHTTMLLLFLYIQCGKFTSTFGLFVLKSQWFDLLSISRSARNPRNQTNQFIRSRLRQPTLIRGYLINESGFGFIIVFDLPSVGLS